MEFQACESYLKLFLSIDNVKSDQNLFIGPNYDFHLLSRHDGLRTRSQVTIGLTFEWEMEGKATAGKIGYGEGVHTKWLATTVDFEGRRMLV